MWQIDKTQVNSHPATRRVFDRRGRKSTFEAQNILASRKSSLVLPLKLNSASVSDTGENRKCFFAEESQGPEVQVSSR